MSSNIQNDNNPKKKELHPSVKRAFFVMGLAFLCLMAATFYTVKISLQGFEGSIDKYYYEKGMNYKNSIDQASAVIEEGYKFESKIFTEKFPLVVGDNPIAIQFAKKEIPIKNGKITISWERGATNKFNSTIDLTGGENGVYSGVIKIDSYGQWLFTIKGIDGEKELVKTFPIIVQN